jgi:hypothetical protein
LSRACMTLLTLSSLALPQPVSSLDIGAQGAASEWCTDI